MKPPAELRGRFRYYSIEGQFGRMAPFLAKVLALWALSLCCVVTTAQTNNSFQHYAEEADKAAAQDHLDQAISLYRRALQIKPNWKQGWWKLGTSLYDQDHYNEAGEAFAKLASLDPKNGSAHLFLGLCQYE